MFLAAERAVLAYCEGLTDYALKGFGPRQDAMRDHFSEAEIATIVKNMNLWNRLKLAQGATPVQEG